MSTVFLVNNMLFVSSEISDEILKTASTRKFPIVDLRPIGIHLSHNWPRNEVLTWKHLLTIFRNIQERNLTLVFIKILYSRCWDLLHIHRLFHGLNLSLVKPHSIVLEAGTSHSSKSINLWLGFNWFQWMPSVDPCSGKGNTLLINLDRLHLLSTS